MGRTSSRRTAAVSGAGLVLVVLMGAKGLVYGMGYGLLSQIGGSTLAGGLRFAWLGFCVLIIRPRLLASA